MSSSLFQPKSRLGAAFNCTIQTGKLERYLKVFRWEDRVVAHEEASGLWWGTLDEFDGLDPREFWYECVESERVGRLFSRRRNPQVSRNNEATLLMGVRLFHLLVAQDNSGLVRTDDKAVWHSFPAIEVWGVRKPSRPTIWRRSFLTKFAVRGWSALDPIYEKEALETMPEAVRALWSQGANSSPLRLVRAAIVLGWVEASKGQVWNSLGSNGRTLDQFWHRALESRPRGFVARSPHLQALPQLLQSPEAALPGKISLSYDYSGGQLYETVVFLWESSDVTLLITLRVVGDSAHEQLELSLELREWLARFYPRDEVESWFKN